MNQITQLDSLPEVLRFEMPVVAKVLPFRVNQYVINEFIDWDNARTDPMLTLTLPRRDMLVPENFKRLADLVMAEASDEAIR